MYVLSVDWNSFVPYCADCLGGSKDKEVNAPISGVSKAQGDDGSGASHWAVPGGTVSVIGDGLQVSPGGATAAYK